MNSTRALRPYVVSRLLIGIAAVVVVVLAPKGSPGIDSAFMVWDGHWYLSIAEHGYVPGPGIQRPGAPEGADERVDGAVAFLPLYPLVIAAVDRVLPGSPDTAAIALSLVIGGASAIAFAALASELRPGEPARRSVLIYCFFPGAFILSLAYAEGLLILLACLCLLALQRRAWVRAGLLAALASATRPNGLALVVACAIAAIIAIRDEADWRSLWAPLLAPAGFLAFMAYLWARTGEPGYWFTTSRIFWHDRIGSWPELQFLLGGRRSQAASDLERAALVVGLLVGFALLITLVVVLLRSRLPSPVVGYALTYEALALLTGALAPRPRFILAAFPLVMALGFALKKTNVSIALVASGAAMVVVYVFYALTYLGGRYLVAP